MGVVEQGRNGVSGGKSLTATVTKEESHGHMKSEIEERETRTKLREQHKHKLVAWCSSQRLPSDQDLGDMFPSEQRPKRTCHHMCGSASCSLLNILRGSFPWAEPSPQGLPSLSTTWSYLSGPSAIKGSLGVRRRPIPIPSARVPKSSKVMESLFKFAPVSFSRVHIDFPVQF